MTRISTITVHPLEDISVRRAFKQLFNGEVLIRILHETRLDNPTYLGGSPYTGAALSDDTKKELGRFLFLKRYKDRIGEMTQTDDNVHVYHQGLSLKRDSGVIIVTTVWKPTGKPPESLMREICAEDRQGQLIRSIEHNMCMAKK